MTNQNHRLVEMAIGREREREREKQDTSYRAVMCGDKDMKGERRVQLYELLKEACAGRLRMISYLLEDIDLWT